MKNKNKLFFILILFLLIFFILLFFLKNFEKERKIQTTFIQKPIDKIELPYKCTITIPDGFTIFKSNLEDKNILSYNFIKYVAEWKKNNFVKIDLTIINKKYLKIPLSKLDETNFNFDNEIIKPKINLSNELKRLREKLKEKGEIYDIDYSQYKPQYAINGIINNRIWRRYALQLVEIKENGKTSIVKIWNNLYTVYKDYIFICDYVCEMGIKINNKYIEIYSESVNGIDKLAQKIISSINFE
ncbi:MAG: hypothetical protein N2114_03095 [Candidatus Goldbacteria bacterium]|nr:hypothetical protein [Candidatus Goldiibacteriota bacterium]